MRNRWRQKPVVVLKCAPQTTRDLAVTVSKLFRQDAYQDACLRVTGPIAIEKAKRGRSLRDLARASGLSPTYLSLVARGQQRISLAALNILLGECEGAE